MYAIRSYYALRESADGFYIAERDLELRGPGEVLGTRQTGLMEFRVARITSYNVCYTKLLRGHAAEVIGREKHLDSIYKKMKSKRKSS